MHLDALADALYREQEENDRAAGAVSLRHIAQELHKNNPDHAKMLAMRHQDDIYANFRGAYKLLVAHNFITKLSLWEAPKPKRKHRKSKKNRG